jgi:hypothetical protein
MDAEVLKGEDVVGVSGGIKEWDVLEVVVSLRSGRPRTSMSERYSLIRDFCGIKRRHAQLPMACNRAGIHGRISCLYD